MFELNGERRMLVESVRELATSEFSERAGTWQGEKPWPNIELLADHGYLGISLPEEYGGGGLSEFDALLLQEVIGRVCPDTAYALPDMGAARAIAMFGSEAAKQKYLPPVTAGDDHIAIAISEPEAGSDVNSMTTTITEQEGDLILNGEKIWVSGVPDASAAVVWTQFPEGLGTVVMEFDSPGVNIVENFTNMFGHTQTQFYMDDVVIQEENVLTRGPEAFKKQLKALNWERLGNAALSNSMAMHLFDRALEYAQQREQFGRSIGDFQGIEWKLADMAKQIQLSRNQVHTAARLAEQSGGVPDKLSTHIANLWSGETLENVATESLQIHGANGYQQGHPIEYFYRFARSRRIAAGTDEIQKNTIADSLKSNGLPSL
jgi:alkylation response protein AidB-like acyl-CoA dehydrogenase